MKKLLCLLVKLTMVSSPAQGACIDLLKDRVRYDDAVLLVQNNVLSLSDALPSLQSPRQLKRAIRATVANISKNDPTQRWSTPVRKLLVASALRAFLRLWIEQANPHLRRNAWYNRWPRWIVGGEVSPDLATLAQSGDFPQFYTAYAKKFIWATRFRYPWVKFLQITSLATALSSGLGIYWYEESNAQMKDLLHFSSALNAEDLRTFNRILDQSTFPNKSQILAHLRSQPSPDPAWHGFLDRLQHELESPSQNHKVSPP
jgi:hypothetical protein